MDRAVPIARRDVRDGKPSSSCCRCAMRTRPGEFVRFGLLPICVAQLLTDLKLSSLSLGLIINWNVILLRDGIQRVVRNHPED
jgi:hypothetical protein